MASETQNYGYPKPEPEDFIDIGDFSRAMDMIDEDMKEMEERISDSGKVFDIEKVCIGANATATGNNATAVGKNAAANNESSTALGYCANAAGYYSTALGHRAEANYCSTAVGLGARAIDDGSTSLGYCATAKYYHSTAAGYCAEALGYNSAAVGSNSAANKESSTALGSFSVAGEAYSTALGEHASANNEGSTAVGSNASARGYFSTALGIRANARGYLSTALGHCATANGSNSTALGEYAATSNANSIQLGNASYLSSITARVAITVTSDERDKADITEMDSKELDFLKKVKAIRYVFNSRELYINEENLSDEERRNKEKYGLCAYDREEHAKGTKKGNRIRTGVSAQNVLQALKEVYGDTSYANLVNDNFFDLNKDEIPEGVENQLAVNYEGFIPFLIKAVQELSERLEALESENRRTQP